jgi:hypothetical protein
VGLGIDRQRGVGDPPRLDGRDGRGALVGPDRLTLESTADEWLDLDDDGRIDRLDGCERPRLDAASHRDADVGLREIIGAQRLVDPIAQVIGNHAGHTERLAGRHESLAMALPEEHLAAVRSAGLEGGVAVPKAAVVDGNGRSRALEHLAVDVVVTGHALPQCRQNVSIIRSPTPVRMLSG